MKPLDPDASHDIWTSKADNAFAKALYQSTGWPLALQSTQTNTLCNRCAGIDVWAQNLQLAVQKDELAGSSRHCHLCKLLYVPFSRHEASEGKRLLITRVGSGLIVEPDCLPILSLYIDPGWSFAQFIHSR
jgi:hypothetical protein